MIKLLSVNLNYYNTRYGDWIDRKQRLIQKIRECDPDILTLQAVKHDPEQFGEQDQVSQLSKSMPEYPYHQFFPVTSEATDGSGFISKIQASETDTKYLSFIPGLGDPNHRIVVRSTIDRFDAQLHVFNSHLSWVREQTEVNIPEVIYYTHKVQGYKILAGDFNTPPDSDLLFPLKASGWIDVWDRVYPGINGFTYESQDPTLRIDYVWVNQALVDKIIDIEIVSGISNQLGNGLSDHFGLLATFDL